MQKKPFILVESPTKAKKIAKFLGNDYYVKASFGHMFDLDKENLSISIDDNFKPNYSILTNKKDLLKEIFLTAKNSSIILIGTDGDREGEGIGYLLAEALKPANVPIKRIVFYEVTKKAILDAINNKRDLDENLVYAQQARRVLDRIVGYSVSPLLSSKFEKPLSAGRVQSVVVRLISDREKEISEFQSEKYWTVDVEFKLPSGETFIAKLDQKISSAKKAESIKTDLKISKFKIKDILKKEKKKSPEPPFITSSLTAFASSALKMRAEETMRMAQSLYEAGYITYMRTDSVRVSPESIDACRDWLTSNNYSIPVSPNIYNTSDKAQDAHEAIRPTVVETTPYTIFVGENEQKVYKLIWDRFVASQMEDAVISNTTVIIKTSFGHTLKAFGNVLQYKGWLELFKGHEFKAENLPVINENDQLILKSIKVNEKQTVGPPRYTEKTLIQELEKRGIGRPSTYATILSKIDKYIDMSQSRAYSPKDIGSEVVKILCEYYSFMNLDYTALMEQRLDEVASGKLKYGEMLKEFFDIFIEEQRKAYKANFEDKGFRCVDCSSELVLDKQSKILKCINYPFCDFKIFCNIVDGKVKIKKRNGELAEGKVCPNCSSGMYKIEGKYGLFYSCSEWPLCLGKLKG